MKKSKSTNALKDAARMNAYCIGKDDYPKKDVCPYEFGKEPDLHTSYWNGWNEAAIEQDREENLS